MTLEQYLAEGIRCLEQAGIADASLDAWYLLSEAFSVDRTHYFLQKKQEIRLEDNKEVRENSESRENRENRENRKKIERYQNMLERRAQRIPLQQILGNQEFMALPFRVDEHVLIPRQDTETLVELVLSECKKKESRVLDVCTGSGCIALSLAVLGGYQSVTATDLSKEALRIASENVRELYTKSEYRKRGGWLVEGWNEQQFDNLDSVVQIWNTSVREVGVREAGKCDIAGERGQAEVVETEIVGTETVETEYQTEHTEFCLLESDLFQNLRGMERFDVLVSNPPYIPSAVIDGLEPEVRDHEPRMALDGMEDGLYFYRKLAKEAGDYLKDGAHVYFEIGFDQGEALRTILMENGFENIRIIKDLAGNDRVAAAVWSVKTHMPDARDALKRGGDGPH